MLAIVVHEPGGPEVLQLEERPVPEARPGWVLVRVRAFGLNRSELVTRAGGSGDAVRFPRVLGIECVGEVVDAPGADLRRGERVLAAMGGMGREFDGGYAQYALLPASSVIPVQTELDWARLGAIPESFGTAWGSLDTLGLERRESVLIRGGSSSVGMAAVTIANERRLEVFATTRQEHKRAALEAAGADHVIIDDGLVANKVREIAPEGVDGVLELVGPTACVDSLRALGSTGRACISGFLENLWTLDAAQAEADRLRVPLARYRSDVINVTSYRHVFAKIVRSIEGGRLHDTLDRTYAMTEIAQAHRVMEANEAAGKLVVLTPEGFE
jgi:NADPH:quinone reductase-like Zn-dependent oxidoreductase